jgi:hypothetical protein
MVSGNTGQNNHLRYGYKMLMDELSKQFDKYLSIMDFLRVQYVIYGPVRRLY